MIPSKERTLPGEVTGKEIVKEIKTLPKTRPKFDKSQKNAIPAHNISDVIYMLIEKIRTGGG